MNTANSSERSFEIEIESRDELGSSQSRRSRRDGYIPSVVYARGEQAVSVKVPEQAFVQMARLARASQVFVFKSSNPELNKRSAVVKGIQKNHLDGKLLHIDFQKLRDNEDITVSVVLRFEGEAPGVKVDGGILTIARHDLPITCLPKLIPHEVIVDVSTLGMGQRIHASDLKLPEGVRLHGNPEETIVSVVAVRQVVEEAAAATPAEGVAAAAAAAPGAEGAAAAGADKKAAEKKPADKK